MHTALRGRTGWRCRGGLAWRVCVAEIALPVQPGKAAAVKRRIGVRHEPRSGVHASLWWLGAEFLVPGRVTLVEGGNLSGLLACCQERGPYVRNLGLGLRACRFKTVPCSPCQPRTLHKSIPLADARKFHVCDSTQPAGHWLGDGHRSQASLCS